MLILHSVYSFIQNILVPIPINILIYKQTMIMINYILHIIIGDIKGKGIFTCVWKKKLWYKYLFCSQNSNAPEEENNTVNSLFYAWTYNSAIPLFCIKSGEYKIKSTNEFFSFDIIQVKTIWKIKSTRTASRDLTQRLIPHV